MGKARSALFLSASRIVGILISLVSVPIFLRVLGPEGYGSAIFVLVIGAYVTLLDSGINDGTQRHLNVALAEGDTQKVVDLHRTHIDLSFVLSLLYVVFYAILAITVGIPGRAYGEDVLVLYLLAGIATGLSCLAMPYSVLLTALLRFGQLATVSAVGTIVQMTTTLAAVLVWREPWAYFVGGVVGAALQLVLHRAVRRKLGLPFSSGRRNWTAYRPVLSFGLRAYPNRFAALLGGADRLIIGSLLGPAAVGVYNVASQIPNAALQALPVMSVMGPEFARDSVHGGETLKRTFERNTLIALGIGAVLIMVPCALGPTALRFWLGREFDPAMPLIMALLGVYQMFSLYGATVALALYGVGKPQLVFPFTLASGLGVVLAGIPAAYNFGLVGVALACPLVAFLVFLPLTWVSCRAITPLLSPRAHLIRAFLVVLLGGAAAAGTFLSSSHPVSVAYPWSFLLLGPVAVLAAGVLLLRTGLVPEPSVFERYRRVHYWIYRWPRPARDAQEGRT